MDGFICEFVDLLSYGADRNDRLGGNRGIVESDDEIVIWQFPVFLEQEIQKDICMSIIGDKNTLCLSRISLIQLIQ